MSEFDVVWSEIYPAEKSRVINLLVERVDYDAQIGWRGPELCSGFLSHIHPVHFFHLVAEGGFEPFAAAEL